MNVAIKAPITSASYEVKPMSQFLIDNHTTITTIIAVLAFLQTWAIILWKTLRKGCLVIQRNEMFEAGFYSSGPTLSLDMTFLAKKNSVYVKRIQITVKNANNNMTCRFSEFARRSRTYDTGNPQNITLELAAGFHVKNNESISLTTIFSDRDTGNTINRQLALLSSTFQNNLLELQTQGVNIYDTNESSKLCIQKWFSSKEREKALDEIKTSFYWNPGKYNVTVEIYYRESRKPVIQKFGFELSEENKEELLQNIKVMVDIPLLTYLNLPGSPKFIYPLCRDL